MVGASKVTREAALKKLGGNLPLFYDMVHHLLQDGKSSLNDAKLFNANTYERAVPTEDEAVLIATLSIIGMDGCDVTMSSEDVADLAGLMTCLWEINTLVDAGYVNYEGGTDEYGFPRLSVTFEQYRRIVDILDRQEGK